MKNISLLVLLSLIFISCKKEQDRRLLNAYFKFSINGVEKKIEDGAGLYDNTFTCTIKGDTALYIDVRKQYEGAGIVITGHPIKDTTFTLDSLNTGYYTNPLDNKRYYTTNVFTGTLTIKKTTFEATSTLNTLEGSFSYKVVDTATGRNLELTNGSFLMERKHE